MQTVTPENMNYVDGTFTVVTRDVADDGTITNVHREVMAPGHWEGDGGTTWVATDIASYPSQVVAFATAIWSAECVERYKASHSPGQ